MTKSEAQAVHAELHSLANIIEKRFPSAHAVAKLARKRATEINNNFNNKQQYLELPK